LGQKLAVVLLQAAALDLALMVAPVWRQDLVAAAAVWYQDLVVVVATVVVH
jgi:hypothetical protein